MDHIFHMTDVVGGLHLVRQRQQPLEHDRNQVHVGDALVLDGLQDPGRIPLVGEHQFAARAHGGADVEGQRGRVIGRPGAELDRGLVVVASHGVDRLGRHHRLGAVDALRPPGRAGGVHHGVAQHRVRDVRAVQRGQGLVVGQEARKRASDGDLDLQVRALGGRGFRGGDAGVEEARLGLAILDDVGDLVGGQVPVHRRDPPAGALRRRQNLHELGAVGADQGHGVAGLQAIAAQQAHEAVGLGVDLAPAVGRAVRVVDEGRVRLDAGPDRNGHARGGGLVQPVIQAHAVLHIVHQCPPGALWMAR